MHGDFEANEAVGAKRRIEVWDLPTRLFHWLLVALLVALYLTAEYGPLDIHMKLGYAVLTLVIFRLGWGLFGSAHSRFASFLAGPRRAFAYLRGMAGRAPVTVVGHNPVGGWMVVALLLMLLVQAGTGLFTTDDILTEGPLSGLVSSSTSGTLSFIHRTGFNLLLALVCLHVAAALFYRFVKKDDLITPMVTGWKDLPASEAASEYRLASPLLALAWLVAAGLIVWGIVSLGG